MSKYIVDLDKIEDMIEGEGDSIDIGYSLGFNRCLGDIKFEAIEITDDEMTFISAILQEQIDEYCSPKAEKILELLKALGGE